MVSAWSWDPIPIDTMDIKKPDTPSQLNGWNRTGIVKLCHYWTALGGNL